MLEPPHFQKWGGRAPPLLKKKAEVGETDGLKNLLLNIITLLSKLSDPMSEYRETCD